jgi:uncharacterized protein involved in type VI secretion and phage assembly
VDQYIGKYRGVVLDNIDPDRLGRITVQVADVSDVQPTTWAMPCVPFAGMQNGFFVVPAIGSGVWVEFEQGDPDYPIWTGGFWGLGQEIPPLALAGTPGVQSLVIQTAAQNTLMISDMDGPTGGILLKSSTGAMIAINDSGITISNGEGATIVMAGPAVTVNQGALEVI